VKATAKGNTVTFNLCETNLPATADPQCPITDAYAQIFDNGSQ